MAYEAGDILTFTWSVTNNGANSGLYRGDLIYDDNIIQSYSVTIPAGDTNIFSYDLIVTEGSHTIKSTCGQIINFDVNASSNPAEATYNNDLMVVNSVEGSNEISTASWSITNTGSLEGSINGFLEYYPYDQLYKESFGSIYGIEPLIVQPGQTINFSKQVVVKSGVREIRVTGDAMDTVTLEGTYLVDTYVSWLDIDNTVPQNVVKSQNEPTFNVGQTPVIHISFVNSQSTDLDVSIQATQTTSRGTIQLFSGVIPVPANTTSSNPFYYAVQLIDVAQGDGLISINIPNKYPTNLKYKIK